MFNAKTANDVTHCIARGDDINTYQNGWTPIQHACAKGRLTVLMSLVNHGAVIDKTCSFIASYNCHLDVVKFIGENGGDLEAIDDAAHIYIWSRISWGQSHRKLPTSYKIKEYTQSKGVYRFTTVRNVLPYYEILKVFRPNDQQLIDDYIRMYDESKSHHKDH